jgi:hypothetical protein
MARLIIDSIISLLQTQTSFLCRSQKKNKNKNKNNSCDGNLPEQINAQIQT